MSEEVVMYSECLFVFTNGDVEARGYSHGDRVDWKVDYLVNNEVTESKTFGDADAAKDWGMQKVFG